MPSSSCKSTAPDADALVLRNEISSAHPQIDLLSGFFLSDDLQEDDKCPIPICRNHSAATRNWRTRFHQSSKFRPSLLPVNSGT